MAVSQDVCAEDDSHAGEDLVLVFWNRHDEDLDGGAAGVGTSARFNYKFNFAVSNSFYREQVWLFIVVMPDTRKISHLSVAVAGKNGNKLEPLIP